MTVTDPVLEQIARALRAIEENLDRPLPIEELAQRAGYSTWHFQRLFMALVDESVAGYVRRRRLTEAAKVLRAQPERRLLDIAISVGFESHEAFTRAFRRESGHTPSGFRTLPNPNLSWMRLPLPPEHLQLLPPNMNLEPTLLDLPAFSVAGLSSHFIAAVSPDSTNMKVIPPLWQAFMSRQGELRGTGAAPEPGCCWGVCRCLPPEQRSRDDELEYLAGVKVAGEVALPADMVRWEIPARKFARFTHVGPIENFGETLRYIYGAWLPRSDYNPTMEVELEYYDHRFNLSAADSEIDYFVGIEPKA